MEDPLDGGKARADSTSGLGRNAPAGSDAGFEFDSEFGDTGAALETMEKIDVGTSRNPEQPTTREAKMMQLLHEAIEADKKDSCAEGHSAWEKAVAYAERMPGSGTGKRLILFNAAERYLRCSEHPPRRHDNRERARQLFDRVVTLGHGAYYEDARASLERLEEKSE